VWSNLGGKHVVEDGRDPERLFTGLQVSKATKAKCSSDDLSSFFVVGVHEGVFWILGENGPRANLPDRLNEGESGFDGISDCRIRKIQPSDLGPKITGRISSLFISDIPAPERSCFSVGHVENDAGFTLIAKVKHSSTYCMFNIIGMSPDGEDIAAIFLITENELRHEESLWH
jgi:hypothetical protein